MHKQKRTVISEYISSNSTLSFWNFSILFFVLLLWIEIFIFITAIGKQKDMQGWKILIKANTVLKHDIQAVRSVLDLNMKFLILSLANVHTNSTRIYLLNCYTTNLSVDILLAAFNKFTKGVNLVTVLEKYMFVQEKSARYVNIDIFLLCLSKIKDVKSIL